MSQLPVFVTTKPRQNLLPLSPQIDDSDGRFSRFRREISTSPAALQGYEAATSKSAARTFSAQPQSLPKIDGVGVEHRTLLPLRTSWPQRIELCLHYDTPPTSSGPPTLLSRASHSFRAGHVFHRMSSACSEAPAASAGRDESLRGHTCIFDRGADHLEPAEIKQRCLPPCFSSCSLPSIHSSFFPPVSSDPPVFIPSSLEVSLVHRR